MDLFAPWRLSSDLAALHKEITHVRRALDEVQADMVRSIAHHVVELEARIARETLSWGELYDKTYHLQKRIEQRQRTVEPPTDIPGARADQITERVLARRRKGREA